ncbi:matrix metalloproteinase-2-like isoform X2 [Artemia franciscana]|uniref:matrix metalloproteinase-2-like isoform X2 n=1 Tax=Artemia franciscana TaxID=6661 RepID=UPI0032DAD558
MVISVLLSAMAIVLYADTGHGVPVKEVAVNSNSHKGNGVEQSLKYSRRKRKTGIDDHILNYMMRFGYLPTSDLETGNLRSEEEVIKAIKEMQRFGGIPETGIVDTATRKLMNRKRCGLPDKITDGFRAKSSNNASYVHQIRHKRRKRYILQGQKWKHVNLTWSVRQGTKDFDINYVRREVYRALDLWAQVSQLTFSEVDSEDADIRVYFHRLYHGDGYPFDGKGTLLAHAFFPGNHIGGDAHFDDDENWTLEPKDGSLTFYAVAAHEFGHSLGLSHSSDSEAIMFPYYQHSSADYTLGHDDVLGIQALYGASDDWGNVTPSSQRPPKVTVPPKPTRKPSTTDVPIYRPTTEAPIVPETCDTSYDAISLIRGEVFVFKGKYYWRIQKTGVARGFPVEITRFWNEIPHNISHVDAVYERQNPQRHIVMFIGQNYYVFNGNTLVEGPSPLSRLGLPEDLIKIDGAMVWGHNKKTYFFSGTMYWRFDEEEQTVELDYPRDMSMWKGVPYNIDSVFQWTDSKTYFFKGKVFWQFNDMRMRVVSQSPSLSAPFWMGCPTQIHEPRPEIAHPAAETEFSATSLESSSDCSKCSLPFSFFLSVYLLLKWFVA